MLCPFKTGGNRYMKNSYHKLLTPLYVINIVLQAMISLISPIAVMFFFAWLLVTRLAVGSWIYVVFIMIGVFSGLYSMVVFILGAMRTLDAIEKQHSDKKEETKTK